MGELPAVVAKCHEVWADSALSSIYSYVRARNDTLPPDDDRRRLLFVKFKSETIVEAAGTLLEMLYPGNDSSATQAPIVKFISGSLGIIPPGDVYLHLIEIFCNLVL